MNEGDAFLPGLPVDLIRAAYRAAPGNEIDSGKFFSPESSAALVANVFGYFLERPRELPSFPGGQDLGWPALSMRLEATVRFPWAGGRHPCLDVLVETGTALIGIESKRYEPVRDDPKPEFSPAYWRPVWGEAMTRYEQMRDGLRDGTIEFSRLDAAQLVKHAFGLRTAVHRDGQHKGKRPVLIYLHAEPANRPDGGAIPKDRTRAHRDDVVRFTDAVKGDEVEFLSCTYRELLAALQSDTRDDVRSHANLVADHFDI